MKRITKILVLLLVICQLLSLFSGCKKNKEENTAEETQAESAFDLTLELLKSYVIVWDRTGGSELREVATSMQKAIEQKTGVKLTIKEDYVVEGSGVYCEAEHEILIGKADRAEAKAFYADLRVEDHGYALVGKKLLILGYTPEYASKSVVRFQSDILRKTTEDASRLLAAGDSKIVAGNYRYDSLTINGVDISKYSIVYPEIFHLSENDSAVYLQEWISSQTGRLVPVVSDFTAATEYEIQVGDTNRITEEARATRDGMGFGENKGYVGQNGNGLWISGKSRVGLYQAMKNMINMVALADNTLLLEITSPVLREIHSFSLSVMSYNIYFDLNETQRNPNDVIASIQQKDPDVFGLNESGADWLKKMDASLSGAYASAKGRALENASDALYNAIYFKKDKFELVESGTKWLSATPDRVSKYPEAKHYKGMTYAILRDKATGVEFMYLNVHLDGSGDSAAHAALKNVRKLQAQIVHDFVAQYSMYPVIIGGDFNEGASSDVVKSFSQNGRFRYCGNEATEKTIIGTTDVNNTFSGLGSSVFDYLFVSGDSITVQKYEQWDNKMNGKYPSDHLPVYGEITIFY